MITRNLAFAAVLALLFATAAGAQYPILDTIADKVVQKYEHATCEELWEKKREPKLPGEREIVEMLRGDRQMRTVFIDRIAAPIANKMFECGMIP